MQAAVAEGRRTSLTLAWWVGFSGGGDEGGRKDRQAGGGGGGGGSEDDYDPNRVGWGVWGRVGGGAHGPFKITVATPRTYCEDRSLLLPSV